MSPKTKLLIFALFIGFVLTFLFYLMGIPFGLWGYSRALFVIVIMIAIILYALLTRIAEKLRQK